MFLYPWFYFKLTYLMTISLVLSSIPNMLSMIRLPIYNWAALTCFRILSRSFSGVVRFHNEQFRPKSDGICVANHTTPIDVVVLSCDRSYALVTKLEIASGPNFALFWLDLVKIGLIVNKFIYKFLDLIHMRMLVECLSRLRILLRSPWI